MSFRSGLFSLAAVAGGCWSGSEEPALPEGNETLGIAKFVEEEVGDQTTLRGLDASGNEIARLDLVHGHFKLTPPFADEYPTSEVDGRRLNASSRFLIEATGRDTFMASRIGIKRKNTNHTSAALYGHFRGAQRNPGDAEGDIEIYWFAHGWMWFIPLADGTTSVGAVCWPYYLKTRDTDPSTFFLRTLQTCPPLWERVKNATLVEPATATGNYSYTSDRMAGDRYVLVGDAFAFVDPVFSSGVYLAMNSAQFAAGVIDGALRDPSAAPRLNRAFERRVRRGLKTFTWMIYRMTSPIMRNLIMNPRDIFGVQRAVISFLAGDVYDSGPVRRRVMAFRGIYYLSALKHCRHAWRSVLNRKNAIRAQTIYATDGSG